LFRLLPRPPLPSSSSSPSFPSFSSSSSSSTSFALLLPPAPLPGEATPAMLAALRGNAEALHMLIASGARVDACDARGDTCLHYAIRGRCEECLDALASCPGARGLLQPEARGGRAEELQALARSLSEGASPEPGEVQRQLAALLARRHRGSAAHKGTMSVKPTAVRQLRARGSSVRAWLRPVPRGAVQSARISRST
ncbi:unnamed protein product, partial [Prorocentrum cordatum]